MTEHCSDKPCIMSRLTVNLMGVNQLFPTIEDAALVAERRKKGFMIGQHFFFASETEKPSPLDSTGRVATTQYS